MSLKSDALYLESRKPYGYLLSVGRGIKECSGNPGDFRSETRF